MINLVRYNKEEDFIIPKNIISAIYKTEPSAKRLLEN